MRKYLCFLLIVALMCTMIPVSAAGIEVRDLMDYMFDLNVDPLNYIGAFENFISYTSDENGYYTLREAEYFEETIEDITFYLSGYGALSEDVRSYCEDFYTFFEEKPEMFTLFMSYVSNYENALLPFPQQNRLESELSGVVTAIRDNFYCETFFLNLMASINDKYYAAKKDMAFMYYNENITLKDDAVNYIDFLLPQDRAVASYAHSEVASMLDMINNMSSLEKSNFAEFMISIGIMSLNMNDSSNEGNETVDTHYQRLDEKFKNGDGIIMAFEEIDNIVNEFIPEINGASQGDKEASIYEAMTKAATVRIDGRQTLVGDKNVVNLVSNDVLTYAVMRAQKVRNALVSKNITVSQNQPYTVKIIVSDNVSNGFRITLSKSALGSCLTYHADKIHIIGNKGRLFGDIQALTESGAFAGSSMVFEVYENSAENVISSLKEYAQGNNIIKIIVGAGNVDYDTMHFEKDVSVTSEDWSENKVYSISADGERVLVDYYEVTDDIVSFEIGNQKYFARIEGELQEIKPEVTPAPTNKPTPTPSSRPSWGDEEDDDPVQTPEITPTPSATAEPTTTPEPTPERGDGPDKYPVPDFSDVADNHWAKEFINNLCAKGILNGIGNNMFAPDQNVTREQFAKIIAEAFGLVNEDATCDFSDVESGSWYEKYVASVYEKGIVNGIGDNMFGTGKSITRQDMATMIIRAAKACNMDISDKSSFEYNDHHKIADYAKEAVEVLVGWGVVSGFEDNTFRPLENSTRAQVAKIVSGVLERKNK